MKKLLVTGSLGLTGSACVEHFSKKGWDVVGVDANLRAKFFGTEKQSNAAYDLDLRDAIGLDELFATEGPFDAIIHTAAQPSHDYSTDHALEDFDINARATLILLELTRKHCPDATFVFCSTDKVYGENMTVALSENATRFNNKGVEYRDGFTEDLGLDEAGDRSLFGCSKAAADMYVQVYAIKFQMKTVCFRLGCITGKKHQGSEYHGFLAYLAKCIKDGTPYKVHGNGKQVRDQIHASDLAKAFDYFIQDPKQGAVYNMGGGPERSISLLEAAAAFTEVTGKPANLVFGKSHRKGDRLWDVHDISRFLKDYPHFDYSYSLQDIIKDLV